ncbi:MAG: hypothetical protein ACK6DA_06350 [Candidatus Kapaibacterium sp.]
MKKVFSQLSFLSLLLLGSLQVSFAQIGTTISLSGVITPDQSLSTFVGASLAFVDPSGKENRTKTDKQGNFTSVVLQPNTQYTLRISGTDLLVTTHPYTTPNVSKFTEVKQNFSVMAAVAGRQLFTTEAFALGTSQLTESAKVQLTSLIELLKQNRGLSVSLSMPKEEAAPIQAKAKAKKTKKSKEQVEEMPNHDSQRNINQERIDVIQQFLADVKSKDKRVALLLEGIIKQAAAPVAAKKTKKTDTKSATTTPDKVAVTLTCKIMSMNNI